MENIKLKQEDKKNILIALSGLSTLAAFSLHLSGAEVSFPVLFLGYALVQVGIILSARGL